MEWFGQENRIGLLTAACCQAYPDKLYGDQQKANGDYVSDEAALYEPIRACIYEVVNKGAEVLGISARYIRRQGMERPFINRSSIPTLEPACHPLSCHPCMPFHSVGLGRAASFNMDILRSGRGVSDFSPHHRAHCCTLQRGASVTFHACHLRMHIAQCLTAVPWPLGVTRQTLCMQLARLHATCGP